MTEAVANDFANLHHPEQDPAPLTPNDTPKKTPSSTPGSSRKSRRLLGLKADPLTGQVDELIDELLGADPPPVVPEVGLGHSQARLEALANGPPRVKGPILYEGLEQAKPTGPLAQQIKPYPGFTWGWDNPAHHPLHEHHQLWVNGRAFNRHWQKGWEQHWELVHERNRENAAADVLKGKGKGKEREEREPSAGPSSAQRPHPVTVEEGTDDDDDLPPPAAMLDSMLEDLLREPGRAKGGASAAAARKKARTHGGGTPASIKLKINKRPVPPDDREYSYSEPEDEEGEGGQEKTTPKRVYKGKKTNAQKRKHEEVASEEDGASPAKSAKSTPSKRTATGEKLIGKKGHEGRAMSSTELIERFELHDLIDSMRSNGTKPDLAAINILESTSKSLHVIMEHEKKCDECQTKKQRKVRDEGTSALVETIQLPCAVEKPGDKCAQCVYKGRPCSFKVRSVTTTVRVDHIRPRLSEALAALQVLVDTAATLGLKKSLNSVKKNVKEALDEVDGVKK